MKLKSVYCLDSLLCSSILCCPCKLLLFWKIQLFHGILLPLACVLCASDFLSLPATLCVHFLKRWIGDLIRSSYQPACGFETSRCSRETLLICFLGLELHYLLSVIFTSLINCHESFICFASLCYFRSTLLSYLHSVCTQDSFRCLFTTVFGLYLNPCSSQWAEHVAPSVKTRIEVMLHFIHFPSETTDRYQQSLTVFVQVCLHTVKRNGIAEQRITWTAGYIVSKTRVDVLLI